jgi:N-acetylglutamate synthase-like GNAT family acetyltransferase
MVPVVRKARSSDKEPLMSFIKDVWGGHDYIPRVWDQWIKDTRNKMFVVEVDGKPVGMNRIRFLEDGSAWFEGARIHPDYRGRGLASMLGENSMMMARRSGIRVFRLTSGSRNHTAHRQIARISFREIARFSVYEAPKGWSPKRFAVRVDPHDAKEATAAIRRTKEFRLGTGVFWHNFSAATLTPEVVRNLAEEGSLWRYGSAVAVARNGGEGPEAWEEICFVGGPPGDALKLVKSLIGRRKKATRRWAFIPQGSPLGHAFREAGFKRNYSNILFERRAAKG